MKEKKIQKLAVFCRYYSFLPSASAIGEQGEAFRKSIAALYLWEGEGEEYLADSFQTEPVQHQIPLTYLWLCKVHILVLFWWWKGNRPFSSWALPSSFTIIWLVLHRVAKKGGRYKTNLCIFIFRWKIKITIMLHAKAFVWEIKFIARWAPAEPYIYCLREFGTRFVLKI